MVNSSLFLSARSCADAAISFFPSSSTLALHQGPSGQSSPYRDCSGCFYLLSFYSHILLFVSIYGTIIPQSRLSISDSYSLDSASPSRPASLELILLSDRLLPVPYVPRNQIYLFANVQESNLDSSIESLLNAEKQARLSGDVVATRDTVCSIIRLCFEARAWKTLNDQIVLLSKRRGQLKQVTGIGSERIRIHKLGFEI